MVWVVDQCAKDTENWQIIKDQVTNESGFPIDYHHSVKLKAKHSPKNIDPVLHFGYHEHFQRSYAIFKEIREQFGLSGLRFQVGIPTGLGLAFGMLNPIDAFRYSDAFNRRLALEVNEITKQAGDDVVIQIELPIELSLAQNLPKFMVNQALRSIWGLVRRFENNPQGGVHLCWGDLNNKAFTQAKTLEKAVHYMNHMVQKWPNTAKLEYLHLPIGQGDVPPSLDEKFYEPLKQLQLPEDIRFIAGIVHEKRSLEELKSILKLVESARGKIIDVASACGLGRRDAEVATHLLKLTQQLAYEE